MSLIGQIDWQEAMFGGVLIGLASALLLLLNGKIAGISGILGGIFFSSDRLWRVMFILGLLVGGGIIVFLSPQKTLLSFEVENVKVIWAGLLVGIGTSLGNGCTSGHGVCGISRLSKRSIIATIIFMSTGFLTLFVGG